MKDSLFSNQLDLSHTVNSGIASVPEQIVESMVITSPLRFELTNDSQVT